MKSVYSAVRTESLYNTDTFSLSRFKLSGSKRKEKCFWTECWHAFPEIHSYFLISSSKDIWLVIVVPIRLSQFWITDNYHKQYNLTTPLTIRVITKPNVRISNKLHVTYCIFWAITYSGLAPDPSMVCFPLLPADFDSICLWLQLMTTTLPSSV